MWKTVLLSVCLACWGPLPLDQQVRSRALIVQGSLLTIDAAKPRPPLAEDDYFGFVIADRERFDRATLRIDAVLKTPDARITAGSTVILVMPAADRRYGLSTDVIFPAGSSGIWMLNQGPQGWVASRPSDLRGLDHLDVIRSHIAEQR